MALDFSTPQVGARSAGRWHTDDFHETPSIAVEALLSAEIFSGPIWECAAGLGAISKVLIEHGHSVVSTDLVVFSRRLPMMHRHGWTGRKASSAIPHAWFVWSKDHSGVTAVSAGVPLVIVEDWKPVARNTLLGLCRVRLPSGMILHDVALHMKNDRLWATPSSKPRLGRDLLQMRDADGKTLWTPIVAFETKALSDRFSAQVIEALRGAFPNALPDPAAAEVAP